MKGSCPDNGRGFPGAITSVRVLRDLSLAGQGSTPVCVAKAHAQGCRRDGSLGGRPQTLHRPLEAALCAKSRCVSEPATDAGALFQRRAARVLRLLAAPRIEDTRHVASPSREDGGDHMRGCAADCGRVGAHGEGAWRAQVTHRETLGADASQRRRYGTRRWCRQVLLPREMRWRRRRRNLWIARVRAWGAVLIQAVAHLGPALDAALWISDRRRAALRGQRLGSSQQNMQASSKVAAKSHSRATCCLRSRSP
ncbi:hypothetical protein F1559_003198 [Cyanidiococcus yangmingshanensis]|uniref:Uncharacterized protein n=1 Tax=Cyanidiococcus yangmingshanensis TaxID=2690220 RepID=A0A7J7IME3_9RHOD|nr:hypothetical protein F1559_003198 [Cyanidiococcus yangmingshanensis]